MNARWLTVVGIGEDGVEGLGERQRSAISSATHVFGGLRHLELAGNLIQGQAHAWPTPFSVEPVLSLRGQSVCVLASGDPMLFGVGATFARFVSPAAMRVLPAPSAFSLAAARQGWALQDVEAVSLHGRPVELILPLLHEGRCILALTSDDHGPRVVARLLTDNGFGASRITVLESIGGQNERIRSISAASFNLNDVNALNVLAIEVESDPQARELPLTAGRANDLFENDGQLTKQEVRAVTLASLAPKRGQILWDVGAGSGSIAIEWMMAHPSMRAIAIEADPVRAERIARNARKCGVPGLRVVQGFAPEALESLSTPDAIFIGGGGSDDGVLEAAINKLVPKGRLVANAVTLEFEQMLLARQASLGGKLLRIAISHASAVGSMQAWRPAMPVTQWVWTKP